MRADQTAAATDDTSCKVSLGRYPIGPDALAYDEGMLPILRAGGVSDRASAHAIDPEMMLGMIRGLLRVASHREVSQCRSARRRPHRRRFRRGVRGGARSPGRWSGRAQAD